MKYRQSFDIPKTTDDRTAFESEQIIKWICNCIIGEMKREKIKGFDGSFVCFGAMLDQI